jgi:glucose/arabinose dehydrogenase
MRCAADGSGLELVAWGLRNAFGLGFLPDGRLLAVDQGADDRGSRPIGDAPDLLYEVRPGAWCGWPDFIGGEPVTAARFAPRRGPHPDFLLANHAELPPPQPALLAFPAHSAAVKFDVLPAGSGRWSGHLVVALFGDERPMTAPAGPRAGRMMARIDPSDWSLHLLEVPAMHRPIDVRVDPRTGDLLVLDFGRFEMHDSGGVDAQAGSGVVRRVASSLLAH